MTDIVKLNEGQPKQNDPDVSRQNRESLEQALSWIYNTKIYSDKTARLRGEAIQSLVDFYAFSPFSRMGRAAQGQSFDHKIL